MARPAESAARTAIAWLLVRPGRALGLILLLHLAVQGTFLGKVPPRHLLPHVRWEIPAVAMALYERGEFADPYCMPTGPTAHMPPFQPALMAVVYLLLGPSLSAGYVIWILASAGYGVMYGLLLLLAATALTGGVRPGNTSGTADPGPPGPAF